MILVVEDDLDVREVTADLLRDAGGTVVEAVEGVDALTKLEELERPCLIIVDLVMPRMDGLEFLKRLQVHRHVSGFSIVLMTARSDMTGAPGFWVYSGSKEAASIGGASQPQTSDGPFAQEPGSSDRPSAKSAP